MCFNRIKNILKKINRNNLDIAFWNGIGTLLAVGIPTFIDPLLEHHVRYGSRTYPLGKWVLLISLLVFCITLILNATIKSPLKRKALFTLFAIIIPTWALLPFFKPESPHFVVTVVPIFFGSISATVVLLRDYQIDFSYLLDSTVSIQTKLERLKIEYDYWYRLGLALLGTYGLFFVSFAVQSNKSIEIVTKEPSEIFLLNEWLWLVLIINAIWFLYGILGEIIKRINDIKDKFNIIK